MSASLDPEVMYLHQAIAAPDRKEFPEAMAKEVESHTTNKNWIIVDKSSVPINNKVLPEIWARRQK
jgi:hypothetical protein